MSKELTRLDDLYPESDAATKRDLEGFAHAIGHFRAAMHQIAEKRTEAPAQWNLVKASAKVHSKQRRVVLEWAAAMALCVAVLVPAVGSYRNHVAAVKAEQQAQLLKQHEADAALLDQVSSEISEAVPDSLQPLADLDSDYTSDQAKTGETENKNGRN
jgi:hypothetical protein